MSWSQVHTVCTFLSFESQQPSLRCDHVMARWKKKKNKKKEIEKKKERES